MPNPQPMKAIPQQMMYAPNEQASFNQIKNINNKKNNLKLIINLIKLN